MAAHELPVPDESTDGVDELNEHVQDPGDPDGLVAAEERLRRQESGPAPQTAYRAKRRWPKVLITIVVALAAPFGAYWLGTHEATKKPPTRQHTGVQKQSAQLQTASTTKHYDSTNYTLGFDYPDNWTVSDSVSKLTIVSPVMQLVTATGAATGVHVVVTIQNQQTIIPGFPANGATAAAASDHLTYKQPSSVQRAQTYLSYLSYAIPTSLDVLYITGDNGYQQGQLVPMTDVVKGNPLISVTFQSCTNDNCGGGKLVSLSASEWRTASASKEVTALIESIVLQG
jgi:hypothetical protein